MCIYIEVCESESSGPPRARSVLLSLSVLNKMTRKLLLACRAMVCVPALHGRKK